MAKTILLERKKLQPKIFFLNKGKIDVADVNKPLILGRKTDSNPVDIDMQCDFVSRQHGEFAFDNEGVYYIDTRSTNGTYYNGKKVTPGIKQYLSDGDTLHIFNGNPSTTADFTCLIFSTNYPKKWESTVIEISDDVAEINIGRVGKRNLLMNDAVVSANHASFFIAKSGWAVIDHDSTNGVYLNNTRINQPQYIRVGDCIRVANINFIYTGKTFIYQRNTVTSGKLREDKSHLGSQLDIRIVERSVWQRTKKLMLLQNINMTINPGEMILILGGSGAGKTTFMNAVMGYEKAEGTIMHGDIDVYEDFESMKYKIGFVPQQDLLRGNDSVYDTLENAAQMKLHSSIKKEQREQRIDEVLNVLGLLRESKSLVSKLSGGQRKRLSIAVEYIADPSLFFLDEPDSGLDGVMARALMDNLRAIADEGKIVMVISHSPDRAADLFDRVIVLAKSVRDNCGHLAFFGSVDEAYDFFDTDSLEGVVRRINRKDEGGDGMSDFFIDKYNSLM